MSPAIIARIELPLMNLRYLGSADWMNSALEGGDIFASEGMMTETNRAAPPIQATIAPMWRINRTRNRASAIRWNRLGIQGSGYYDITRRPHPTFFGRKRWIGKQLSISPYCKREPAVHIRCFSRQSNLDQGLPEAKIRLVAKGIILLANNAVSQTSLFL